MIYIKMLTVFLAVMYTLVFIKSNVSSDQTHTYHRIVCVKEIGVVYDSWISLDYTIFEGTGIIMPSTRFVSGNCKVVDKKNMVSYSYRKKMKLDIKEDYVWSADEK